MTRSTRPSLAKAGAGAALALAAIVAGPAGTAFAAPAFYTPPATLPAENGTIIRSQPMSLGAPVSATAKRIMYKSTNTQGQPVAVTGTYIESTYKFTDGPRPLITYAEGTIGQGDGCAPSFGLGNPLGGNGGGGNIGYEVPSIYGLVNRGYAVVITDYVGLGTPGVHTYVNRLDQGHAVLDAARAALQVSGPTVTSQSPVGAYGYSQGGGAVASAAELAPSYAPDVNLKGAYAGAPPADLDATMRKADGTSLTTVIGFAVNGFIETYPELKPILDRETNATGKAALATAANACIGEGIANFAFKKTSQWTASGKSIAQIVSSIPEAKAVVEAQKIGTLKPAVPVRISTGTLDDIVPHPQAKQLAVDWCAKGANVSYAPVRQYIPSGGSSLNHLGPLLTEAGASSSWLVDRLNGKPNTSNCSQVSRLP